MRVLQSLFRWTGSSLSCTMGLILHLLIVIWIISLLLLPPNTQIRPLEWLVNSIGFNLNVFLAGSALAIYDWRTGKKLMAVVGFFLCSSLYAAVLGYFLIIAFVEGVVLSG